MNQNRLLVAILSFPILIAFAYFFKHPEIYKTLYPLEAWGRFVRFLIIGLLASSFITVLFRSWALIVFAVVGLFLPLYSVGPLALRGSLFLTVGCWSIGRLIIAKISPNASLNIGLQFFVGASVLIGLMNVLTHFSLPVYYVYLLLCLGPLTIVIFRDGRPNCLFSSSALRNSWSLKESLILAVLGFLYCLHLVESLFPEVAWDALATHLYIPSYLAHNGQWHFDVQKIAWGVIPMGGDWLFSMAYTLGDDFSPRLFNVILLFFISLVVFASTRQWLSRAGSLLCMGAFASMPLVHLVSVSVFVENVWCGLLISASACLLSEQIVSNRSQMVIFSLLLGAACATKPFVAMWLPAFFLALLLDPKHRKALLQSWSTFASALATLVFVGLYPYAVAFFKTGNPVFPFSNHIFKSPFFDSSHAFVDNRWVQKISIRTLYDMTFHSNLFLEAKPGSIGFHFFLLAPLAAIGGLIFRGKIKSFHWLCCALVAFVGTFWISPYLRYLYPTFVLVIVAAAGFFAPFPQKIRNLVGTVTLLVILLNIYFFPAACYFFSDFPIQAAFSQSTRLDYEQAKVPQREVITGINSRFRDPPPIYFPGQPCYTPYKGLVYGPGWYHAPINEELRLATDSEGIGRIFQKYGIELLILPKAEFKNIPDELFPLVPEKFFHFAQSYGHFLFETHRYDIFLLSERR